MIERASRIKNIEEYYFSKKLKEVVSLEKEGRPIINMGIGSPDLPPDKIVFDALKEGLSHPKASMYQSYQGLPELRKAIADFYKNNYNVNLDYTSEVLPLMGSKEGIMHISMAFLNKGDKVLIPNPGYPTYSSVAKILEAEPVYYDLVEKNNWQPDWSFLDSIDSKKIKLMWLNYPNMPTGAKIDLNTFDRLIDWAKSRKIILVNDNPYSFILNNSPESILSRKGAFEVCLELNSLSKTFNMAGWRVGMLLGSDKFIKDVIKIKSNIDSGMFYGIQKGAIASLNLKKSWFKSLNKIYSKRRENVYELAQKLNTKYDRNTSGLFVWAKLHKDVESSEKFINKILYNYNIFITPGSIFGSKGDRFIRLSLCVDEKLIKEAIKRLDK
jgi:aspartate/methionine/tyrosine aminotransferase